MTIYRFNIFISLIIIVSQIQGVTMLGEKMKPFSIKKLNGNGFVRSKDILRNGSIGMVFFNSENTKSLKMVNALHQIKSELSNKNIKFFLINVLDDEALLKKFVVEKVYTIPILLDLYGIVLGNFQSNVIPLTVIVGSDSRIEYYKKGFQESDILEFISFLRSRNEK